MYKSNKNLFWNRNIIDEGIPLSPMKAWDKLCRPKHEFGYQKKEDDNVAFLAKQS